MEHYISLYIDNELTLGEKIRFVEIVHQNERYKDEAVMLLEQEKVVGAVLQNQVSETDIDRPLHVPRMTAFGKAMAAFSIFILAFLAGAGTIYFQPDTPVDTVSSELSRSAEHRFILYLQDSTQVELTGSFTNWRKIPLTPVGMSGYWEIVMDVPSGEHRYSFIVDGTRLLPDPTSPLQETDDFGTINSILTVENEI